MKRLALFALWVMLASIAPASAHPWGGLVIDAEGHVFFSYTCPVGDEGHYACVMMLDAGTGEVTEVIRSSSEPSDMVLARSPNRSVFAAERVGSAPWRTRLWQLEAGREATEVLPFAGPDSFNADPYAVGDDGTVSFFVDGVLKQRSLAEPEAETTTASVDEDIGAVRLLLALTDGDLLAASNEALYRLDADGTRQRIASPLRQDDPPGLPFSGGNILFDMATEGGTTWFAYYGNREVFRTDAGGERTTVLESGRGWSVHGVDVFEGRLYVLESSTPGWRPWGTPALMPRVRMLSPDGSVTVLYDPRD